MTSLLKKLSIFIKIGVIKRYGVWSVSKLSTESVGCRRELVANCVHTADADATKQFRRVGGVYWALLIHSSISSSGGSSGGRGSAAEWRRRPTPGE